MDKENEKPVGNDSTWQGASQVHDSLHVDTNQQDDHLLSPTIPQLVGLGLDLKGLSTYPGNAFALIKETDGSKTDGGKPPRKSTGSSGSNGSSEASKRPPVLRKMSSLDYDERLALPMPKPWHPRNEPTESEFPFDDESTKPNVLKKRVVTDPVTPVDVTASESGSSHDASETRKVSRIDMIKSKLSFKDLRKESAKQEHSTHSASQGRRVFTSSAIPSLSSSLPGPKTKEATNPTTGRKISSPILVSSATMNQIHATTKIPLPPSGTFSHAQSTTNSSRRSSTIDKQASTTAPELRAIKMKSDSTGNSPSPNVTDKGRRGGRSSRASSEIPSNKPLPTKLSSGTRVTLAKNNPLYQVRGIVDGQGAAKYSMDNRPSDPSASRSLSGGKFQTPSPTVYSKGEVPGCSIPEYLRAVKEDLNKGNATHAKDVKHDVYGLNIATHVDDIVDMICSIQRQLESGIAAMTRKLEDLSAWVGDQLKNQIESNSDLSRANSDLFTKQYQISREMMKFQLDIRLDIGTMERRMGLFENKVLDDLQNEVRSLARSYEELSQKTEMIIEKYSFGDTEGFIDQQLRKNTEIERELSYLKARQENLISREIAPFAAAKRVPSRRSLSSHESSEPLIKQVVRIPPKPAPSPEVPKVYHHHPRPAIMTGNKPPIAFPRSVSLTKKGLLKGIKDITSSSPEPIKERPLSKIKSNDDSKRWNVFGLRRKREPSDTMSKFPWSPRSRRNRGETIVREDTGSSYSRSSTPPMPFVPRNISQPMERTERTPTPFPAYTVHPALRESSESPPDESVTASYETALESTKLMTSLEKKISEGSADTFAKMTDSPSISADDHPGPIENVATPASKKSQSVHDDVSLGTILHRTSEDTQAQSTLKNQEQEWDHVSVNEAVPHV